MLLEVGSDPLIGTVIDGRFEVLARLGAGGMGTVYRARQKSIGRDVALKVLDTRFERDEAALKRFYREAKLASSLSHPNTVGIIEFGQNADGKLYLAMELVRGRTLFEEIAKRGALPIARITTIGTQLCDALDVAHGQNIVHRDLKLENVMLLDGERDHVKILDFGLALIASDPQMRATATGMISGTPRYMPPEVAFEAAAPAAPQDMYAFGVMLGELALGKPLWTAPTVEALFMKKMATDEKLFAAVPAPLRALVRALLADKPDARPTAAAALVALRELDTSTSDRRRTESASTEPPPLSDDAAAFDISASKLVDLDHRADAPETPQPRSVIARPPPDVRHSSPIDPKQDPFAAPYVEERKLELDAKDWLDKRAEKQAIAANPPPEPPPPFPWKKLATVIATLAIIGGIVAVALYVNRAKPEGRQPQGQGNVVQIQITAKTPAKVSIDGNYVGKTPLTLNVQKGTKQMLITSPEASGVQFVPDHDQTIELQQ